MTTEFDFHRMISPVEVDDFLNDYWQKRPLILSRQQPAYYADLLTMQTFEHLLFSMAGDPDTRVGTEHGQIEGATDINRLLAEYQRGATISLRAYRRWKPLLWLCQQAETLFNHAVGASTYLTPKGVHGLPPHYDDMDVFVLQIAGSKYWRIYDAPYPLPLRDRPFQPEAVKKSQLLHEITLQPGDLLYLPRGYVHEAASTDSASLHITLDITVHTWLDLLSAALEQLGRQDVRFREALPVGFIAQDDLREQVADGFREMLTVFAEKAESDDGFHHLVEKYLLSRAPLREGYLTDLDQLEQLDGDTLIRQRAGMIAHLIPKPPNAITFVCSGKQFTAPKFVEPVLRFIATTQEFRINEIPSRLKEREKLVIVRRLLKDGFLTIVRHNISSNN